MHAAIADKLDFADEPVDVTPDSLSPSHTNASEQVPRLTHLVQTASVEFHFYPLR